MSDTASISFIGVTLRKYMPGIRRFWSSLALSKKSRIGLRALSLESRVWGVQLQICKRLELQGVGTGLE